MSRVLLKWPKTSEEISEPSGEISDTQETISGIAGKPFPVLVSKPVTEDTEPVACSKKDVN